MKRILFRLSVIAAISVLGMLAIAHAQRPAVPQQDDTSPNPLRQDAPLPVDNPPPSYRVQEVGPEVGPVDTAPAPDGNPLRRRPPETGPTRIRLIAGEEPVDARGPDGRLQVPASEPRLMPVGDDRNFVPSRTGNVRGGAQSFSPEPTPMRVGRTSESVPHNTDGLGSPSYNRHEEVAAANGTGQPGDKQLEGPQNAQIVLQKMAPPEIQVGRPAVLRTVVRNGGTAPAADVEIHDQVPRGTRLLGTAPQATQGRNGELLWSLGTLKPGSETTVEMQIMPVDEGEVGSVATVRFQTVATARSMVTRPRIVVTTSGPQRVLVGEEAVLTVVVSNPGSGVAHGVTLVENVPEGLTHPAGPKLVCNFGELKPGESRKMDLPLRTVKGGTIDNLITASADANLHAEHHFKFEIVSPKLAVELNGPKKRYLEREATYQLSVTNHGTAAANQFKLVAYLPVGLKFVSASKAGHYDAATQAVYWEGQGLEVNENSSVELVTMPVAAGQYNLKVRGMAQRGVSDEKEQPVVVEGLAAVLFQLSHTKDPLEIGGETTYEISVVNQGSKASTNLQMSVILPPELKPLAAEGPTRYTIEDNKVLFEGLPQLAPKSVAAFRVRAKGIRAGDLRVRCQLMTDEMQRPVVKEESTRVYADE